MAIPRGLNVSSWWGAYVGLPYLDRGRTRSGVDCWGLVMLVYADHGLTLPGYGDQTCTDLAAVAGAIGGALEDDVWRDVAGTPRALDVVLMTGPVKVNGQQRRMTIHCGVMVDDFRVLHVERQTDSCVLALDHDSISRRVARIVRHRSLA